MEVTKSMVLFVSLLITLIAKRSPWSGQLKRMSRKQLVKVHYLIPLDEWTGEGITSETGTVNGGG